MPARAPVLAKLARPKVFGALPRVHLFALIDEAAKRPIVWISAPPGAGKTTLIASYLETRRLRHLWYQCDAGDGDSATFVHYLRMAAHQLGGAKAARLPLFTAEPQQDLPRFARGFSRDVFAALRTPCAVVFDNFHEPRTQRRQRTALAQAFEEIPEGVTVIVLSRSDPPPEFARLVARGRIARIDETELRCTAEEAEAILAGTAVDPNKLQKVYAQSDGWVAALVLLREHLSRKGATAEQALGEGKDSIFRYFAGEIFNRARPENRRVLMLTAIAPSITAFEAVELCGNTEAPRLLEYLYRRHLFTDRRHGEHTTYQYHALFREFLLHELIARLPRDERVAATKSAAALLAARGEINDALSLYRAAEAWDEVRSLVCAHALEWAREGRAQALSDWIEALPAAMRKDDPWLEYWAGRAWVFVHPLRGRPAIERAYEAFGRNGDRRGEALALSTLVTSYYYEWANFMPLERLLPEFERLFAADAPPLDAESELRARAAWLMTLLLRRPDDPNISRCAERLDALLDGEKDLNLRVLAGSTLFNYVNWTTHGERAPELIARIEPMLVKPDVSALMQVQWRTHVSFWHYMNGRYAEATQVIGEARAIAERYGLEAYLFDIDHAEASALINNGNHDAAKLRLEAMERRLSPTRRMQWPFFHHLRSVLDQRLGRRKAAIEHAERAATLARELDVPSLQIPHFLARLAQARAADGDRGGAIHAIDEAIVLAAPGERMSFEQRRVLLEIEADLSAGDLERVSTGLAAVLGEHRARADFVFMRSRPDLAARFANHALEHGIETEFVRTLIRRDRLVAPPDAGPSWPFRLRIRVLGAFDLVRDDEPLRFTGKSQERPLDVLKLLIAHGGKAVDIDQFTAALWPDSDGAASRRSFESALFRLRKLVGVEEALVLTGRKLSLVRSIAWTDLGALDAMLESMERIDEQGRSPATLARRLLDAYSGPLFGSEEERWMVKPREALRARVIRTLTRLGEQLERRRDWTTAADVYRRGLEADSLCEPLYRGLMRALAANGEQAEALLAFRRCRELLSIVLGVKPSQETERIHRDVVAGVRPTT